MPAHHMETAKEGRMKQKNPLEGLQHLIDAEMEKVKNFDAEAALSELERLAADIPIEKVDRAYRDGQSYDFSGSLSSRKIDVSKSWND